MAKRQTLSVLCTSHCAHARTEICSSLWAALLRRKSAPSVFVSEDPCSFSLPELFSEVLEASFRGLAARVGDGIGLRVAPVAGAGVVFAGGAGAGAGAAAASGGSFFSVAGVFGPEGSETMPDEVTSRCSEVSMMLVGGSCGPPLMMGTNVEALGWLSGAMSDGKLRNGADAALALL